MKVNVLGTEYTISFLEEKDDFIKNHEEVGAYTDPSSKKIAVYLGNTDYSNLEEYRKRIIRHELIHAFLYESGLDYNSGDPEAWAINEEMVDWIALQFPKMLKVFKELDVL